MIYSDIIKSKKIFHHIWFVRKKLLNVKSWDLAVMGWVGYPLIDSMSRVLFKNIFFSTVSKKSFDPLEIMTIVHWPTSSSPLEVARQKFGFACRSSHRCPHRGLWRTHLEKVWLGCFLSWKQFEDPFGEKVKQMQWEFWN